MTRLTDTCVQALRRCQLFADLDEQPLSSLASYCRATDLPAGRLLFARGDPADGLRVMMQGLIRVWLNDADGNELTLALLGPGEALGEMALIDGGPRSASATALGPGRALYLDARDFARVLEREPAIARHLVELLAARLRASNDAMLDIAFLPLRTRLCRKLLDLAELHARPAPPGAVFRRIFSQTDLAQMLGVSREAVNRQLKAMRHDGDIRFEGRRLAISDLARLEAISELM